MIIVGALLAAGHSRRFGAQDKLLAPLNGRPLVSYAATAMRKVDITHRIAVVGSDAVGDHLAGFDVRKPAIELEEMSQSLRVAVQQAELLGADQLLISLGDMPFVTTNMLSEVLALASVTGTAAVTDGMRRMPPACFPASAFAKLSDLSGDTGATQVLRELSANAFIRVDLSCLRDIDTQSDLAACQE